MTSLRFAVLVLLAALGLSVADAGAEPIAQTFEHGGGCRKDSPPGRCCHMDHSTGTVHCH